MTEKKKEQYLDIMEKSPEAYTDERIRGIIDEIKRGAKLATVRALAYLNVKPISHIKNRYDIKTCIGGELYGYFNKYMITWLPIFL